MWNTKEDTHFRRNQSAGRKNKLTIAITAAVISMLTIVVIVMVRYNGATAKKVKEQLSLGDKYLSELQYEQALRLTRSAKRFTLDWQRFT